MPMQIDHIILNVNDLAKSIEFYRHTLGFEYEGERAGTPFSIIRVATGFMLQLAPFGTRGGEHMAFSMSRIEFEQVFQRVRETAIDYGESFDTVGSMRGPGDSEGARGLLKSVYFFDPNKHLIEIAYYETEV